jgi:catechol 2,3-dioxygenase-like lactoylglutathione lyase family enzyme
MSMDFVEVTMDAPSPGDQRAFYGDALGLPVVDDPPEDAAFEAGRTRIRFRRAAPGTTPTYHFALRVPGNQFREAKSWLAGRTELLREGDRDEFDWDFWGARAVYARDPAGNIVELMGFADLPPLGEGEFGPASILGMAELGLPVADVQAAVAELRDAFGIGLWDRDDVTPEALTPVGERGATFLVVRLGRVWHLGGVAADHPLEVTLGGVADAGIELAGHPYSIRGSS